MGRRADIILEIRGEDRLAIVWRRPREALQCANAPMLLRSYESWRAQMGPQAAAAIVRPSWPPAAPKLRSMPQKNPNEDAGLTNQNTAAETLERPLSWPAAELEDNSRSSWPSRPRKRANISTSSRRRRNNRSWLAFH